MVSFNSLKKLTMLLLVFSMEIRVKANGIFKVNILLKKEQTLKLYLAQYVKARPVHLIAKL